MSAPEKSLKSIHKKVDFMMSLFRSDSKYSDMFKKFESSGASGSGGCGDDEDSDDDEEGEDENGDDESGSHLVAGDYRWGKNPLRSFPSDLSLGKTFPNDLSLRKGSNVRQGKRCSEDMQANSSTVVEMMKLALWWLQTDPTRRHSMSSVVKGIVAVVCVLLDPSYPYLVTRVVGSSKRFRQLRVLGSSIVRVRNKRKKKIGSRYLRVSAILSYRTVVERYILLSNTVLVLQLSSRVSLLESLLKKEFDMKELGEAKKILGMEIVRDRSRKILRVSQSGCICKCGIGMLNVLDGSAPRPDIAVMRGQIHLSRNHVFHERTKHINVRYHFIREVLEAKTVKVLKVGTEHNAADALTKVVPGRKLQHCLELLKVGVG
ncbi:hypothetical protein Tco_0163471 [Tanacetum coccineum]